MRLGNQAVKTTIIIYRDRRMEGRLDRRSLSDEVCTHTDDKISGVYNAIFSLSRMLCIPSVGCYSTISYCNYMN